MFAFIIPDIPVKILIKPSFSFPVGTRLAENRSQVRFHSAEQHGKRTSAATDVRVQTHIIVCGRRCRTQYGSSTVNNHRETLRFTPDDGANGKILQKFSPIGFEHPSYTAPLALASTDVSPWSSATSKVFGLISVRFFRPGEPYNINKVLRQSAARPRH